MYKIVECPAYRCYYHCTIKRKKSSSVSAKSWNYDRGHWSIPLKTFRKFIKYCVRDTKNLTESSKKTHAKELVIFPSTYSFTSEFFNKFVGFQIVKKVLGSFYLHSGTFIAGSSRLNVFYKHELLKKSANFTGKYLCQVSCLLKLHARGLYL